MFNYVQRSADLHLSEPNVYGSHFFGTHGSCFLTIMTGRHTNREIDGHWRFSQLTYYATLCIFVHYRDAKFGMLNSLYFQIQSSIHKIYVCQPQTDAVC